MAAVGRSGQDAPTPAPADRLSLRRELRAAPAAVWWLTVLHLLLLLSYANLLPTYRGPDETHHVDMVLALRWEQGYPAFQGERFLSERIPASYRGVLYDRLEVTPLQPEQAPPREDRWRYEDFGPDEPSGASNQMWQHPPLHYAVTAAAWMGADALLPSAQRWSFDQVVAFQRLVSVILVAPLPLIVFGTGRRLLAGRDEGVALAAAVVPLLIPQLTHIGSAVNNDNLLNLLSALLLLATAFVVTGDTSRRTAVMVGAFLGAALLTKGFALPLIPVVAFAYALAWWRGPPERRRQSPYAAAVAFAVAFTAGGWWYLRNLVVLGSLQPTGRQREPVEVSGATDWWLWTTRFVEIMHERFWGSFSRWDYTLPLAITVPLAILVAVGVALALLRREGRLLERPLALYALSPLAVTFAVIIVRSMRSWTTYRFLFGQGRYLFPALVGLAVVVAAGLATVLRARALPFVLYLLAGLVHAVAVLGLLLTFWGSPTATRPLYSVQAVLAWSPWPRWYPVLVWLGIALAGVACLHLLWRAARPRRGAGARLAEQR